MAAVYRNATLTIFAMAAKASNAGILTSRPLPEKVPVPTTLQVHQDNDSFEVTVERAAAREESLGSLYHHCPLSSRGWTLQESILSRRHLYYGARQIYWKCPAGLESADGICVGLNAPDHDYKALSNVLHTISVNHGEGDLPDKSLLLQEYYRLVEDYSRRQLTRESDKLPAFSGLARRFQQCLGADYLTGLWSTDLERGLLWRDNSGCCMPATTYRAPSWSWAVTDGEISFDRREPFPPSSLKMKILEYDVTLKNRNELYGEVQSGYLVVDGLTTVLRSSLQEGNLLALNTAAGFAYFDGPAKHQSVAHDSSGCPWVDVFWMMDYHGNSYPVTARHTSYVESASLLSPTSLSEEQYTLLLVYADDTPRGEVECLILRQVSEADTTFARVGTGGIFERVDSLRDR